MRKFSSFVRPHLASQQRQAGDHPDANVLLAFSERNLSPREQAALLTHLAECPDCREILALSSVTSEHEAPSPRVLPKARATWWGWRLAATAAVICSVIGIVWRPSLFISSPEVASSPKPKTISRPPSFVPAPLAPKAIEQAPPKPHIRATRNSQASPKRNGTELPEVSPAAQLRGSPDEFKKSGEAIPVIVPPVEPQPVPPNPAVASAPSSNVVPATAPNNLMAPRSMLSADRSAASVRMFQKASHRNRTTVWSLEGSPRGGTLQKSDDNGRTWRTVPVDEAARFYALSATGSNIWVGGADGKLFHSADGGLHWTAISVADEETTLADTIIGIDIGGESITLRTNSGATWTTDDGGAHWRRK